MAKDNPLITMSTLGVIADPVKKANRLYAHYLRSYYSQSTVWFGSIKSLSHTIKSNTNDMSGLASQVSEDLTTLFEAHFAQVDFTVRYEQINNGAEYTIYISGTLQGSGASFDFNETLQLNDGVLKDINDEVIQGVKDDL